MLITMFPCQQICELFYGWIEYFCLSFFLVWLANLLGEDLRVFEASVGVKIYGASILPGGATSRGSDTCNLECWQSFHKLTTIPACSNWQPDGLAAHKSNDTGGPACAQIETRVGKSERRKPFHQKKH